MRQPEIRRVPVRTLFASGAPRCRAHAQEGRAEQVQPEDLPGLRHEEALLQLQVLDQRALFRRRDHAGDQGTLFPEDLEVGGRVPHVGRRADLVTEEKGKSR